MNTPNDPNNPYLPQQPQQPYPSYTPQQPQQPYSNYTPQQPQQPYSNYTPQFMPPQQPPKKKSKWPWIVGIIVVALALCGIVNIANQGSSTASTSMTTTTTSNTTSASTLAPTQAPTQAPTPTPTPKPLTWKTIKTISDTQSQTTDPIIIPDNSRITWSCDLTSAYGINYNVIVDLKDPNGSSTDLGKNVINEICKKGNTSGASDILQGGTYKLDITAEGQYTLNIQTQQ